MPARVGYSLVNDRFDFSDLPAALDEAETLAVDTVEIPIYAMDLVTGGRILDHRLEAVAAMLAGRPLGYSVHGVLGINFMDVEARLPWHEMVCRANIEVAARLNARHLVIHTGNCPAADEATIAGLYGTQRDHLRRMGDLAGERGVTLCVENVFSFDGLHTATPARLADELDRIDHPAVRATFDVSHGALQCAVVGADFMTEALALAPFSDHLHIHDSFGRPLQFWTYHPSEAVAFGAGDLHLPLGWGDLPFADLMGAGAFPPDALLNIELNRAYWPELADTVRRTRALAGALRQ